jgi:hypothetical protein
MITDVRYTDINGRSHHIKLHKNFIYGAEKNIRSSKEASKRHKRRNEIHKSYSLANIIKLIISRRTRWKGHLAFVEEVRNIYNTLVIERSLVSSWCRLEDNIVTRMTFARQQFGKYTPNISAQQ